MAMEPERWLIGRPALRRFVALVAKTSDASREPVTTSMFGDGITGSEMALVSRRSLVEIRWVADRLARWNVKLHTTNGQQASANVGRSRRLPSMALVALGKQVVPWEKAL
ncbi:hypothetical protein GGD56_002507 [Rhizobium mongolense]|uniref:Phage integrase family protein n=1 Tax=Rhizobium mongolense TaxID=57676 RepID=A0ABR6ILS9_9HYPH|nr:hypothetical protein [Rhizobium mongolense]